MKDEIRETIFKQNAFNREAERVKNQTEKVLKEFIGKPIRNKDGSLRKVVKDQLEDIEDIRDVDHYITGNKATIQVYFTSSEYDLYSKIKFCYVGNPDKHGVCIANYFEDSVYIGTIKDGILTEFYDKKYPPLDEKEQLELIRETQTLLNKVIDKKEKIHFRLRAYLNETIKTQI